MQKILRLAAVLTLLLLAAALAVYGVEARKEVRILCAQFTPGVGYADVIRQLETGNLLQYHVAQDGARQTVTFDSPFNLRTNHCTVELDGGIVQETRYDD